jgi:RNA polymerase sigma factor (sigma-70 family)
VIILFAFGVAVVSRSALAAGVRYLRNVLASQGHHEDSDEQLLRAFVVGRDETAFTALVGRYGPMVEGVCRRVLGHQQDAEDAFQATFLVLAQKGASLRKKTALASFLYGIAYRIALNAKRAAGRRRKHEGSLEALTQPRSPGDPADELSWREVRTLVDEEVARLPEKCRLCWRPPRWQRRRRQPYLPCWSRPRSERRWAKERRGWFPPPSPR